MRRIDPALRALALLLGLSVLSLGVVALQEAMRWADGSAARPNEKAACARAEIWRPHRGVAAHLLWGWYGGVKRGEITLEDIPQVAESRGRGDRE